MVRYISLYVISFIGLSDDAESIMFQVLSTSGTSYQRFMAVLTEDVLAFSSVKGDKLGYWPENSALNQETLRQVFDEADTDGSGCLDANELQKCLGILNLPNCMTTVKVLLQQLDPDESGTLDWDEFQVLAQQAAWSNFVVDFIPLAEILDVTFEVIDKGKQVR